jgi:hypothetical protein
MEFKAEVHYDEGENTFRSEVTLGADKQHFGDESYGSECKRSCNRRAGVCCGDDAELYCVVC